MNQHELSNQEAGPSSHTNSTMDPVEHFVSYSFETDTDYQLGLEGILSMRSLTGTTEESNEDVVRRAKLFYFNCTFGYGITEEDVAAYVRNQAGGTGDVRVKSEPATPLPPESHLAEAHVQPSGPELDSSRILTFAELKTLIEEGRTDQIPNNRVIPNVLNSEPPSESRTQLRRKPWETVVQGITI